jgi:hypothetical protein
MSPGMGTDGFCPKGRCSPQGREFYIKAAIVRKHRIDVQLKKRAIQRQQHSHFSQMHFSWEFGGLSSSLPLDPGQIAEARISLHISYPPKEGAASGV